MSNHTTKWTHVVAVACIIMLLAIIVMVLEQERVTKNERYLPRDQVSYHVTSKMHVVCLGGVRYWAWNMTDEIVGPVIDPQTLTFKRCIEQGE